MDEHITWSNFYMELADKLLQYKSDRTELINKIYQIYDELDINLAKLDSDNDGNSIIPNDIDPFTIFGLFNKQITDEKRIIITRKFKESFNLSSDVPTDFYGIPVLNNLSATFYRFGKERGLEDISNLWELFEVAISYAKDSTVYFNDFISAYDKVMKQAGIRWNITIGLFWIRPNLFISLDNNTREFLSNASNLSESVSNLLKPLKYPPNANYYIKICEECNLALKNKEQYNNFVELSHFAYVNDNKSDEISDDGMGDNDVKTTKYWTFAPGEGAIKWEEFYDNGIMAIGWDGTSDLRNFNSKKQITKMLQEIYNDKKSHKNDVHALWQFANDVQVGDVIFVKRGMNELIGRGIVESDYEYDETRDSYKHIRKVNWEDKGSWYYGDEHNKLPMKTLTDITIYTETVDAINELFGDKIVEEPEQLYPHYTPEDFLNEVYINEEDYSTLTNLLRNKKNLIVEGAPGVGKTFLAKRLAYSIMGLKDVERVMMVQFHQSYSYEDFVMGYRPTKDGFELKHGSFYKFCKKAEIDDENDYFFIIDEINRGNLSKIFGELFMLIENDKRGEKNKIQLLYSDESFFIPKNLHIIGLMNTADRSLAMIDYALRRRFSFFDLKPGFSSNGFKDYANEVNDYTFDNIISLIEELNEEIKEDETLGEGFRIGHSFFCNIKPDEVEEKLEYIIEYEIIPLLKEYWFDEIEKVENWSEKLRNALYSY